MAMPSSSRSMNVIGERLRRAGCRSAPRACPARTSSPRRAGKTLLLAYPTTTTLVAVSSGSAVSRRDEDAQPLPAHECPATYAEHGEAAPTAAAAPCATWRATERKSRLRSASATNPALSARPTMATAMRWDLALGMAGL